MAESINPIKLTVSKEVVRHPNVDCNVELLSLNISVKLNDTFVVMAFDTSSQFSSLMQTIPGSPLQPASMAAVGPDGRKINLRGQQCLRVTIGKCVFHHTFLVLPESSTKRKERLGLDVITKLPLTFTIFGMNMSADVPSAIPNPCAVEGSSVLGLSNAPQNRTNPPTIPPSVPLPSTRILLANHVPHLQHEDRSNFLKAMEPYLPLFDHAAHIPSEIDGVPKAFYPVVIKQLQDFMRLGLPLNLENSSGTPLVVVREKARYTRASYRFCEFRDLDNITKADVIPLPNLQHTFATLRNSLYFTTLDLTGGYAHLNRMLQLANQSEFPELGRYFGVNPILLDHKNAPAAFQKAMTILLEKLIGITCFVYLDVILIFSISLKSHLEHVCQVLDRLSQVKMKVNIEGCHFFRNTVEYLGHILNEEGVKIHPYKFSNILKFPEPQNKRTVKSFLGIVGYYRRFINHFSAHSAALMKRLQKDAPFVWGTPEMSSFIALKEALRIAPLLSYPQYSEKLVLVTKISPNKSSLGANLCQLVDGSLKVIAFASRTLNQKEIKYSSTEKNILCAVWACTHYQRYLHQKFWLETDTSAIMAAIKFRDQTSKVSCWVTKLSKYNYVLREAPETVMPIEAHGVTREQYVHWRVMLASQELDPWIQKVRSLLNLRIPAISQNCLIKNGLLFVKHEEKPVPLIPSSLRQTLISIGHNRATHTGIAVTEYFVRTHGSWPQLKKDVQKYVQDCPSCRVRTIDSPSAVEPFKSSKLMETVGIDFVGPLPSRNGLKYLLSIIDQFSKYAEVYTVDDATPKIAALTLMNQFVPKHGLPERILSDQLSVTALIAELKLLGIRDISVSTYNLHGNGSVEIFYKMLEAIAYRVKRECKAPDWDDIIPSIQTVYLNLTHPCTGFSPHRLLYGRELQVPFILYSVVHGPNSSDKAIERPKKVARRATVTVLKEIWLTRRLTLDRRRSLQTYEQGQLVYLKQLTLPDGVTEKAWCPWIGPLYVTGQQRDVTCEIQNVLGEKQRVHIHQLKPALAGDVGDVISKLGKWSLFQKRDAVQGPTGTSSSSQADATLSSSSNNHLVVTSSIAPKTVDKVPSIANTPKPGSASSKKIRRPLEAVGVSSSSPTTIDLSSSETDPSKAGSQATPSKKKAQKHFQHDAPASTANTNSITTVCSSDDDLFMSQASTSDEDFTYPRSEKVPRSMKSECPSSMAMKRRSLGSQPNFCKKRALSQSDLMSLVVPCSIRLERLVDITFRQ